MILVTGATGFIGKNLVPRLSQEKKVRILVRTTSDITLFENKHNVDIAYGDIENNKGIIPALDNVDMVIHCAARTIGRNFIEYYKTNTIGTANLVKAMRKCQVKRMLFLSTHAVCGPSPNLEPITETNESRPVSAYGLSKKMAERIITNSSLSFNILRPVAIYGPHDIDILKYVRLLNNRFCPIIGYGEKHVNLVYVQDIVELMLKIIKTNRFTNEIYFVSDGRDYTYKEVFAIIAQLLNKNPIIFHIPRTIALFIGLLNDIFLPAQKRLIWRDKVRELAQNIWLCSCDKLRVDHNFNATCSLTEGLRKTIVWYQQHNYL